MIMGLNTPARSSPTGFVEETGCIVEQSLDLL